MTTTKRKPTTTIFLDDETKSQLDRISDDLKIFSRSAVIRMVCNQFYRKKYGGAK